jgi:hypothetical protein
MIPNDVAAASEGRGGKAATGCQQESYWTRLLYSWIALFA